MNYVTTCSSFRPYWLWSAAYEALACVWGLPSEETNSFDVHYHHHQNERNRKRI